VGKRDGPLPPLPWLCLSRLLPPLPPLPPHPLSSPSFPDPSSSAPPFTYLHLPVRDFGQDPGISRIFPKAFAALEEAEREGRPVLVHCAVGANRSATLVIAWLIKSRGWTLRESWEYVRKRKPGVCPMSDNRRELLRFEASLYGKTSFGEEEFLTLR